MNTESRKARIEHQYREDAGFSGRTLSLSKADIRSMAFLVGLGALFALVGLSLGAVVLRLLL
ncbi:hypothetical protein KVG96_08250 [Pseudomonas sp. COR58]|uniref:Uncharacterized protein n=1 Tax=Pseudomonas ekonensis TaxID=2842353 RepID=A0ABS6PBS7_9PSED|nr:hypothetical protein [Pseudomonas ekonensis]MBV4457933.1 hypothetical protein [Pseudomonas ekonensis]